MALKGKHPPEIFDDLIHRYPVLQECHGSILAAAEMLCACYKNNGKALICGNGGSAADSQHIVGELMKSFVIRRPIPAKHAEAIFACCPDADYLCVNLQQALPAISLVNEAALISAYANDVDADMVFAQQVYGYGSSTDVLIAISTSGNSKNVLYACEVAKAMGISVIALTGKSGGMLRDFADVLINVPETDAYKVQELHLPVYHAICLFIERVRFE